VKRRTILRSSALSLTLSHIAPFTQAQTRLTGPIKIVVAWPAGGFVDVVIRALADKLSKDLGTPIIVENKTGAYGLIGAEQVINSAPDGRTWLIGTLGTPMSANLYKRKWVAADELAGVSMVANSPLIAVVPSSVPATDIKQFIELLKSQPGKFNYLNPSIGSASHLNVELIKLRSGVSITSVLYNGQPPGMADLIAGQTHFGLLAPYVVAPHIRSGKLRAIAVAFNERLHDFPDVQTLAEAGYPEADAVASYSVLVPKRTPREVISRFNADIGRALSDPETRKRIEGTGAVVAPPSTPEMVDAFIRSETLRWDKFFRETRITID
jgi:tripartite-type tricarboxylate transporter receptor subunit TctC